MATENSAAIRELFTRLRDLDVRAKGAGDAAGFLDQMLRLAQGGFAAGSTCGPGFVSAFPTIFGCIPESMPFLVSSDDPIYKFGFGTMTWDGADANDITGKWNGCSLFVQPARTGCTARTVPLFLEMYGIDAATLGTRARWIATSNCPTSGKTCSDKASVNRLAELSQPDENYEGGTLGHSDGLIGFDIVGDLYDPTPGYDFYPDDTATILVNYNLSAGKFRVWIPETVTLTDSAYGAIPLVWDGVSWKGCISGISYPGYSGCVARTMAVHYSLNWSYNVPATIDVSWNGTSGGGNDGCPSASTCATTPNIFTSAGGAGSDMPINDAASTSSPISIVWKYTAGTTGRFQKLYRNTTSTITITA